MEMEQQPPLYSGVLKGIARLSDPRHWRNQLHKMLVHGTMRLMISYDSDGPHTNVTRQSLQHLVNFLDNNSRKNKNDGSHQDEESVVITELKLSVLGLLEPPDGGVDVLCTFFSRSDTALTKVTLSNCNFGSQQEASQLLTAFQTNRTVPDLTIRTLIRNLDGSHAYKKYRIFGHTTSLSPSEQKCMPSSTTF